ncbi:MAG: hypothetical protein FWH27_03445 [Planctomycetaceae bacterium]|nr:hypothetical protein [Planctomycetaceae bacterium]
MSDINPYRYSEEPPGDDSYPKAVILDGGNGRIEFRPEKFFGWREILKCGCFIGLMLLIIDYVLVLGFVLLVYFFVTKNWYLINLGVGVLLLLALYLFPWWGAPNCPIPRIISKFYKIASGKGYISQFTTYPSRYKGLRRLEDADDIGVLYLNDDHLHFEGDHTMAVIPYSCIESVDLKNIGFFRGLCLVYHLQVELSQVSGQPFQHILIGDRAAKTLLGSYRTICKIRDDIEGRVNVPHRGMKAQRE